MTHPVDEFAAAEAAAKRSAERVIAQASLDVREVLNMPSGAGARLLMQIVNQTGYFRPNAATNATVYLANGSRNVGVFIMQLIYAACPQSFAKMMAVGIEEHIKRKEK